jgi:hypothetical protein
MRYHLSGVFILILTLTHHLRSEITSLTVAGKGGGPHAQSFSNAKTSTVHVVKVYANDPRSLERMFHSYVLQLGLNRKLVAR